MRDLPRSRLEVTASGPNCAGLFWQTKPFLESLGGKEGGQRLLLQSCFGEG